MTMRIGLVTAVGLFVGVSVGSVLSQQRLPADLMERFRSLSTRAVEFDHQRPAGLRHIMPNEPIQQHVHALVRTPNGNDYGKDLLRQHYQTHSHDSQP